jgi:hypothetical protein
MDNQNCGQEHNKPIKPQPLMDGLVCFEVTHHLEATLFVVHVVDRNYYKTSEAMTRQAGIGDTDSNKATHWAQAK